MDLLKKLGTTVFDFIQGFVIMGAILVPVYMFLINPAHRVTGNSMFPTYKDGELLFTEKVSYYFRQPKAGEVIVFESPKDPNYDYIKRIIAVPNDSLKIVNNAFYVNGEKLIEDYIPKENILMPGSRLQEGVEITIPENEFFVSGDNRLHSSDSREFGTIKRSTIKGHAFLRYWPLNRLTLISP